MREEHVNNKMSNQYEHKCLSSGSDEMEVSTECPGSTRRGQVGDLRVILP